MECLLHNYLKSVNSKYKARHDTTLITEILTFTEMQSLIRISHPADIQRFIALTNVGVHLMLNLFGNFGDGVQSSKKIGSEESNWHISDKIFRTRS